MYPLFLSLGLKPVENKLSNGFGYEIEIINRVSYCMMQSAANPIDLLFSDFAMTKDSFQAEFGSTMDLVELKTFLTVHKILIQPHFGYCSQV